MRRRRRGRAATRKGETLVLLRDGKEVTRGTDMDLMRYIHRHHSYSFDHALKYEGYSVRRERAR